MAGIDNADRLLAAAIALDPDFLLAHVALAVSRCRRRGAVRPPPLPSAASVGPSASTPRSSRPTLGGERRHAADLRREHLLEFPGDLLIVWLPALAR